MVLLIGYGNPGRGDDGLGPALAARMAARKLPGLRVIEAYQLVVEHAADIAGADAVVFADADFRPGAEVRLTELRADPAGEIGSHDVSPASVLSLAALLFGATARGYVLGIPGEESREVHEGLSARGRANLDRAEALLVARLPELAAGMARA